MNFLLFIVGLVVAAILGAASVVYKRDVKSLITKKADAEKALAEGGYSSRGVSDASEALEEAAFRARAYRAGAIGVGIIFLLIGVIRMVPANSVAVPTSFGAIGDPVNSGLHIVVPWTSYHNFSTRIQESQRLGAVGEGDKEKKDCVKLNVGSVASANACVDATVRYAVDVDSVSRLYRRYGAFSEVNEKLIRREVESGLKEVYGDYTPTEAKSGKTLVAIQEKAKKVLDRNLKRYGIVIDSVTIGDLAYTDPSVEANIAAKLAAEQQAERAVIEQRKVLTEAETRLKRADIDAKAVITKALGEAEANRRIAESLTPDLTRLRTAEALANSKGNVTVIQGAGSDTPVIVGNK